MADTDKNPIPNNIEGEGINIPEKREPIVEQGTEQELTPEKRAEKKEDRIVLGELRQEIEKMELDDNGKVEAEKAREKISFLGEKEKIDHLLELARQKGVVFAIQVARRMNEPYLLDILHDTLAQEGYYKDFQKTAISNDDDDNNKK